MTTIGNYRIRIRQPTVHGPADFDDTVVGDAVNLASRLCSVCKGGEILISSILR